MLSRRLFVWWEILLCALQHELRLQTRIQWNLVGDLQVYDTPCICSVGKKVLDCTMVEVDETWLLLHDN